MFFRLIVTPAAINIFDGHIGLYTPHSSLPYIEWALLTILAFIIIYSRAPISLPGERLMSHEAISKYV